MATYRKLTKEEREEKNKEYEKSVAELFINAIKENKAPWQKPWKAGSSMADYNPVTKQKNKNAKPYQGINALYLELVREIYFQSQDPRWMTFLQVKGLNKEGQKKEDFIHVKEGEKATPIKFYTPKYLDKDGKPVPVDENGIYDRDKVVRSVPVLQTHFVFHVSQIVKDKYDENGNLLLDENGKKQYIPAFEPIKIEEEKLNVKPLIEPDTLIKNTNVKIKHDQKDRCYYTEFDDAIHLVPKQQFKDTQNYYDTLLHELTHWTGVKKRLDREEFQKYSDSKEWRAKEELVAEIGGYMLAKECNINFEPTQNNISYVESWCNHIKEKPTAIFEACEKAKKASDYIQSFTREHKKENIHENDNENEETENYIVTKKKSR